MKNLFSISIIAVLITAGCNPKVESESVDQDTINQNIEQLCDDFHAAWNTEDIEAYSDLVSDTGTFFGSDPSELLDKTSLLDMFKELSEEAVDYSYKVDARKILYSADGKSALVVEQITMAGFSSILPLRQTYRFEASDDWKIDFISWGLLAKNEDVEKLNAALE